MGKKRGKKGQRLFLHSACLLTVLLLITGCALTTQKKWQGKKHLDQAEKLINKGDYEGALKEDKQAASLLPGILPGDKALFHMGLIWAHPENPKRDYGKALECFQQVVHNFPNSALMEEARILISAINELILREGRIKERDTTINELKKDNNALKEIDLGIEEKKREDSSGKANR